MQICRAAKVVTIVISARRFFTSAEICLSMSSALQKRRKELRTELSQIEKQIYDLETTYLEETKEFGNIFTGWDSYTSAEKVKQRKNVLLEDRQFSLSSVTSPASRKEVNKKAVKTGEGSVKKRKLNKDQDGDKSENIDDIEYAQ